MAIITIKDIYGVDIIAGEDGESVADILVANKATQSFANAQLAAQDLSGADLTDINLTGADLWKADLTDTILDGAILTGANLVGIVQTPIELTATVDNGPQEIIATSDVSGYDGTLEDHSFILHIGVDFEYRNSNIKEFGVEIELVSGVRIPLTITPTLNEDIVVVSGVSNISLTIDKALVRKFGRNRIWNNMREYMVANYIKVECVIANFIS